MSLAMGLGQEARPIILGASMSIGWIAGFTALLVKGTDEFHTDRREKNIKIQGKRTDL